MAEIKIKSEDELRSAFRPEEYETIELPSQVQFPLQASHYVTWPESSGAHRYLIFKEPASQKLTGLIFRVTRGADAAGSMCNWCHASGGGNEVGMLSVSVNSKRSIGVVACLDLSCIDKVDMAGKLSKKPFNLLAEELLHRIVNFYQKNFHNEKAV